MDPFSSDLFFDFIPVLFQRFFLVHHDDLHICQVAIFVHLNVFLKQFLVLLEVILGLDDQNHSVYDLLAVWCHVVLLKILPAWNDGCHKAHLWSELVDLFFFDFIGCNFINWTCLELDPESSLFNEFLDSLIQILSHHLIFVNVAVYLFNFILFLFSIVHVDSGIKFFLEKIALDILNFIDITVKCQQITEGSSFELFFKLCHIWHNLYLHSFHPAFFSDVLRLSFLQLGSWFQQIIS